MSVEEALQAVLPQLEETEHHPAIVLGTGVSALAVARSLGRRGIPVIALDHHLTGEATLSKYVSAIVQVTNPLVDEAQFCADLVDVGKCLPRPGIIFPCGDDWALAASKFREQLQAYYHLPFAGNEIIQTVLDKDKLYEAAAKVGVPIIPCIDLQKESVESVADQIKFPCILRPAVKSSFEKRFGTSVLKADSKDMLMAYVREARGDYHLLVQEVVPESPDSLYTLACFIGSRTRELQGAFVGIRKGTYPTGIGTSCWVESAEQAEIAEFGGNLLQELNYHGIAEVEFIRDPRDGVFKLLDVNPRPWKWVGLPIESGVDLAWLSYCDALGRDEYAPTPDAKTVWVSMPEYLSFLSDQVDQLSDTDLFSVDQWIGLFQGQYMDGAKVVDALYAADDPLPYISFMQQRMTTSRSKVSCAC